MYRRASVQPGHAGACHSGGTRFRVSSFICYTALFRPIGGSARRFQHLIEIVAIEKSASENNGRYLPRIADTGERIRIQKHKIGNFSRLYRPPPRHRRPR
jgi:hypothetical protein